ncbi:MAG: DUF4124 domain-containing protein [Cellvibrio sp.]|nr:DUF4124 domain-containing protein [Cellvibrio sp.]
MKKRLLGIALSCFMVSPIVMADKIYSWVDSKGVTQYGETPPKDTPARLLNARTGHSDPATYATEEKDEAVKSKGSTAPAQSAERCETARKNLQVLNTSPRVKTTDKNGENRYMTPEEMQTQVENMEAIIADECANL